MSKAPSTTTTAVPATTPGLPSTSRRRLLAGSGLATIAAAFALPASVPVHAAPFTPAMSPEHRDADLLTACVAFAAAEIALYALPDSAPDAVHNAALDRYHDAYGAVSPLQPHTLVGLKAKARVVMSGLKMQEPISVGDTVEDSAEWQVLGAWHLLKDVLALGAVT